MSEITKEISFIPACLFVSEDKMAKWIVHCFTMIKLEKTIVNDYMGPVLLPWKSVAKMKDRKFRIKFELLKPVLTLKEPPQP